MRKYSFLDQDQYKFTMMAAIVHLFPNLMVRYKFINRGKTIWPDGMANKLRERLKRFSEEAVLTNEELDYLSGIRFFQPFFRWVLSKYRFDANEVHVTDNIDDTWVEGYWWRTILWECIFLAMVSELYHEMTGHKLPDRSILTKLNMSKGYEFYKNDIKFVEAGFRRRFSFESQEYMIQDMIKSAQSSLVGTSNVYFAKKYNLIPIGTVAHEWYMAHSALFGFHEANKMAMENWIKVYNGDLGMVLPDTFTSRAFFNVFDTRFSKLFDGFRQDSGDAYEIARMGIENYMRTIRDKHLIQSKTLIFSNALDNIKDIVDLNTTFKNDIITRFMIGTWLSCDIPIVPTEKETFENLNLDALGRVKPLNIVMKLSHVNINGQWIPVVKLGDGKGKNTGDPDQIFLAKKTLNIEDEIRIMKSILPDFLF